MTADERWDDGLRPYRPADRAHAHAVLRRHLLGGEVPFTIHPGDWDWWAFHPDPRVPPPRRLVGDDAVVELGDDGELTSMGLPRERWAHLPERVRSVGWISSRDGEAREALQGNGFTPGGWELALFERATGGTPTPPPEGWTLRRARPQDATARADAARLAFASTMPIPVHRERYRAFMASPGYAWAWDVVAVDAAAEVGAFTVAWPDAETSLAQLEPVGTHPGHQRRGLGRAVVERVVADLAAAGIARVRVCAHSARPVTPPALALYSACGFDRVDTLTWWTR